MAATTLADWKDWKEVAEEIAEANEQMFHTFSASALDLAEANCELNRQLNAISNVAGATDPESQRQAEPG